MMVRFPQEGRSVEEDLVVPAKTQSEQESQRRRSSSGLKTLNDGDYRSETRDND